MTRFKVERSPVEGGDVIPQVNWGTPTSVVSAGTTAGIEVQLTSPATSDGAVIPFVLSSSTGAVEGQHYNIRNAETGGGLNNRHVVAIGANNTVGSVWLEHIDTSSATDHTVTLTLAEDNGFAEGDANYVELSGATLGTGTQEHTVTLPETASGYTIAFQLSEDTVAEPASGTTDYTYQVLLNKKNVTGGDITVDVAQVASGGGSDAVAGDDYEAADLPVTATIATDSSRTDLTVTILSDIDGTGDKLLRMGLSSASGATIDTDRDEFDLTIDEPAVQANSGTVEWLNADVATGNEGTKLVLNVAYKPTVAGQDFITPFDVRVDAIDGAGSSGAKIGVNYQWSPGTSVGVGDPSTALLSFTPGNMNGGVTRKAIELDLLDDGAALGTLTFNLNISTSAALPVGISYGNRDKSVEIGDVQDPGTDVDGDLTDWEDQPRATTRQFYAATDPHMILHPAQGGNPEQLEVTATGALDSGGVLVAGFTTPTEGALYQALTDAWKVWRGKHLATHGAPDTVPIGEELDPVRIQVNTSDQYRGSKTFDSYEFSTPANGLVRTLEIGTGAANAVVWDNSTDSCIRDIVLYGAQGAVGSVPVVPTLPRLVFGNGRAGSFDMPVDNFRLERLTILNGSGSQSSLYVNYPESDQSHTGAGTIQKPHGRIKVYDCQLAGVVESYSTSGSLAQGPRVCIEGGPAAWDVRDQGMPWPTFWAPQDRGIEVQNLVGVETYPELGYAWHPEAPTAGDSAHFADPGKLSSSCFIGLQDGGRYPRFHPSAVLVDDQFQGPVASSAKGLLEALNSPEHNPDADMGSGMVAIMRCRDVGQGSTWGSHDYSFKFWGHNGELYFKDCKTLEDPDTGKGGNAIKVIGEYRNDLDLAAGSGPRGRYRPLYESSGSRTYTCKQVTIDGYQALITSHSGTEGGSIWVLSGVETVKLRSFTVDLWPSATNYAYGHFEMQTLEGVGGDMHTKTFDTADLIPGYVGGFSNYTGFAPNAGDDLPYILDAYHANWSGTATNRKVLTSLDVNNFATHVYSGATSGGVVSQQYTNRHTDSGTGTGDVTPTWGSSGYTSPNNVPTVPTIGFHVPSTPPWTGYENAYYLGEDEVWPREPGQTAEHIVPLVLSLGGVSTAVIKLPFTFTDPLDDDDPTWGVDPASGTLYAPDQVNWPLDVTWSEPSSPYLFRQTGGMAGGSGTSGARAKSVTGSALSGKQIPNSDTPWADGKYDHVEFRLQLDQAMGTTPGNIVIREGLLQITSPEWLGANGSSSYSSAALGTYPAIRLFVVPSQWFSQCHIGLSTSILSANSGIQSVEFTCIVQTSGAIEDLYTWNKVVLSRVVNSNTAQLEDAPLPEDYLVEPGEDAPSLFARVKVQTVQIDTDKFEVGDSIIYSLDLTRSRNIWDTPLSRTIDFT